MDLNYLFILSLIDFEMSKELTDDIVGKALKFAATLMEKGDPHGMDHVKRVLKICKYILEREGGDSSIVYLAAILHDIGRGRGSNHAEKSAKLASQFLRRVGYPKNKAQLVIKAIKEHSFSSKRRPSFIESKILSDADKLDALGAIGIARVFMESVLRGRNIREASKHFYEKILKLPDLMETETGTELAFMRIKIVRDFVLNLEKEFRFLDSINVSFSHSYSYSDEESKSYGQHR